MVSFWHFQIFSIAVYYELIIGSFSPPHVFIHIFTFLVGSSAFTHSGFSQLIFVIITNLLQLSLCVDGGFRAVVWCIFQALKQKKPNFYPLNPTCAMCCVGNKRYQHTKSQVYTRGLLRCLPVFCCASELISLNCPHCIMWSPRSDAHYKMWGIQSRWLSAAFFWALIWLKGWGFGGGGLHSSQKVELQCLNWFIKSCGLHPA